MTPHCLVPELPCSTHRPLFQTFSTRRLTPAAHKILQTARGPSKTRHYKPPANYDDDVEQCSVPSVDSATELYESSPVVPNEPLHSTDVDGPSECRSLGRPALKLDPASRS